MGESGTTSVCWLLSFPAHDISVQTAMWMGRHCPSKGQPLQDLKGEETAGRRPERPEQPGKLVWDRQLQTTQITETWLLWWSPPWRKVTEIRSAFPKLFRASMLMEKVPGVKYIWEMMCWTKLNKVFTSGLFRGSARCKYSEGKKNEGGIFPIDTP